MTRNVKWLIAGAGDIVRSRAAAALSATQRAETVAIFAPSVGKAEELAERFKIPQVYHDYGRALAESGADAVYIATPHHVHVSMALQALEAEKHFLCEKPLGIGAAECVRLLEVARRHPDLVASCSNYRLFTAQFQSTRRLVESGELGALLGGWAHDEEPYYNPSRQPLLKRDGMSPVLGFGYYILHAAQTLFGLPERVFAQASSFNCANEKPYDIDDYYNIVLAYPGGRQFAIHLNFASQAPLRHTCELAFERGRVLWPRCPPHSNAPVRVVRHQGEEEVVGSSTDGDGAARPNWHTPLFQDVTDAILDGRPPVCTLENAVETAIVTDAILESATTGVPVVVPAMPQGNGFPRSQATRRP